MEISPDRLFHKIGLLTALNDIQNEQIAQLQEKIKMLEKTITDLSKGKNDK